MKIKLSIYKAKRFNDDIDKVLSLDRVSALIDFYMDEARVYLYVKQFLGAKASSLGHQQVKGWGSTWPHHCPLFCRRTLIMEAPELFPAGFHYQEKPIAIMQR